MFSRRSILAFLIVLATSLSAERPEYVGIGSYTGFEGIGIDDGFGTGSLYIFPRSNNVTQFFINPEVHLIEGGRWAANAGLGLRSLFAPELALGANAYYDYRNVFLGDFHRVGAGLELITPTWFVCLNGYFPVSSREFEGPLNVYNFPGGFRATCRETENALIGYDADVYHTFFGIFTAGVGTYWYDNGCCDSYAGLKLLGEIWVNRIFRVRGRFYYDDSFNARGQLELSLVLSSLRPTRSALRRFVRRNDMLSVERGCCWTSNF